jgi:hypothetical protein
MFLTVINTDRDRILIGTDSFVRVKSLMNIINIASVEESGTKVCWEQCIPCASNNVAHSEPKRSLRAMRLPQHRDMQGVGTELCSALRSLNTTYNGDDGTLR